jgi:hypothetical protein
MKLLTDSDDFNQTIEMAQTLHGTYNTSVTFHCYWNGNLNEKHLYSILSCYYFNVHNNKHKICLWLEKNTVNSFNDEIAKYADIRQFSLKDESKSTFMEDYQPTYSEIVFYADYVRSLLLYKYGGCWFDLDCFFLRSFDPLFHHYEKDIFLYRWQRRDYPNNAIYVSLEANSEKMRGIMEYIIQYGKGWGFQDAHITYDMPLDILVLPCTWFDPSWIQNPYNFKCEHFFKNIDKVYTFDNFFPGSFCYHWHNRWNESIHENSPIMQLTKIIQTNLSNKT